MRKYIDEVDKVNEIRLLFKHPTYKNKVILIVEGKSDIRLFRGIFESDDIEIETIDGKKQLLSVMGILNTEFPDKLLSICDSDFDHLTGEDKFRDKYSIYITDVHDAEMMMLSSPSLHDFFNEYASLENLKEINEDLLDSALNASYKLGIIRWINCDHELNLNFKGLNFNEFVSVDKLYFYIDMDKLIDLLLLRSKKIEPSLTKDYLVNKINKYEEKGACKFQVCCGHDVTNLIAIAFRQKWASLETNMDIKKVESSLRIGYKLSYFSDTLLFKKVSEKLMECGLKFQA